MSPLLAALISVLFATLLFVVSTPARSAKRARNRKLKALLVDHSGVEYSGLVLVDRPALLSKTALGELVMLPGFFTPRLFLFDSASNARTFALASREVEPRMFYRDSIVG